MTATGSSVKIPLSPSSPPEIGLKRRRPSDTVAKPLPSPQYMSVATKSYVSSYGHTSHMDEATSRSSPRSPSSASSYTRNSTQRNSQPYSTPNSSVNSAPALNMGDDIDQHRDKRQRMEEANGDAMELDESLTPTNHDRYRQSNKGDPSIAKGSNFTMQDGSGDVLLDALEKDMGEPFLFCQSKIEPKMPDVGHHLIGIYGLGNLLAGVARHDPTTHEKINKLRKSYEGQIKSFQLPGRNKPVKGMDNRVDPEPGAFRRGVGSYEPEFDMEARMPKNNGLMPDAQWKKQNAQSEIKVTDDFAARLRRAMQMQPGRVRELDKWDDVLGHEKTKPGAPTPLPVAVPQPSMGQRPNGLLRPPPQSAAEIKRQTRGKKRSYGDNSFVGYGEGFSDPDDAGDDGAYGSEDGGNRKKRRKQESIGGGPLTYGQMQGR